MGDWDGLAPIAVMPSYESCSGCRTWSASVAVAAGRSAGAGLPAESFGSVAVASWK